MAIELLERGISRRAFLAVSLAAAGSPAFGSETKSTRKPLIILFNGGAQSPYEFTTPLIDSPIELRGPVGSILASNGEQIGEGWAKTAKLAKYISLA